ncbi:MAG: oligosaccharide flippase family protein, partial [Lachnospiraceae bacterium]
MPNLLKKIKLLKENLVSKGFFHIIISSSLVKIVSFISAMFLPRFLSKSDYGMLTYIDNIRNYVLLFNAIGISNATIRYCATDESDEKKKGYFIASLIIGILFDLFLILVSILGFIVIPFPFSGAKTLLIATSFLPLLAFLFEDIQFLLRACLENQKYSLISFIYSTVMVVLQISMACLWKLNGIVMARYISLVFCVFIGWILIKDIRLIKSKAIMPHKKQVIKMIKFGIVMLVGNSLSLIMQLNETFIIGQVLKDETALADYKVASYILTISLFILQSVVVFIFPYFVKHADDKEWIWNKFKKVFFLNAAVMIPIHIVLFICSRLFIVIIFGENYISAVPLMRMLLIASLAQALFRALSGNILAGIGEEKFNLKINIIFTILHVIIDFTAIKFFGLNGAAIALTVVYFISGIVMIYHLRKVCKK